MAKYIGDRVRPVHEGNHDKTRSYLSLSVVYDTATGNSYTSRKPVPAGTLLTNTEYWVKSADYNAQFNDTNAEVAKKRDKSVLLTQSDLSTSSESHKLTMNHLSQEVKNAMTGTAPVSPNISDGQVSNEKIAKNSITYEKNAPKTKYTFNMKRTDSGTDLFAGVFVIDHILKQGDVVELRSNHNSNVNLRQFAFYVGTVSDKTTEFASLSNYQRILKVSESFKTGVVCNYNIAPTGNHAFTAVAVGLGTELIKQGVSLSLVPEIFVNGKKFGVLNAYVLNNEPATFETKNVVKEIIDKEAFVSKTVLDAKIQESLYNQTKELTVLKQKPVATNNVSFAEQKVFVSDDVYKTTTKKKYALEFDLVPETNRDVDILIIDGSIDLTNVTTEKYPQVPSEFSTAIIEKIRVKNYGQKTAKVVFECEKDFRIGISELRYTTEGSYTFYDGYFYEDVVSYSKSDLKINLCYSLSEVEDVRSGTIATNVVNLTEKVNNFNDQVYVSKTQVENLKNVWRETFKANNAKWLYSNAVVTASGLDISTGGKTYYNDYFTFDTYRQKAVVELTNANSKFGLICHHSIKGALYLVDTVNKKISLHQQYTGGTIPTEKVSTAISFDFELGNKYLLDVVKTGWKHTFKITDLKTLTTNVVVFDNQTQSSSANYCGKGWGGPGVVCFEGSAKFLKHEYDVALWNYAEAIFIGDSITEGTNMGANVDISKRWCSQLRTDYFKGNAIICGRGGANSADVLTRLNTLSNHGFTAKKIIVLTGTNERSQSATDAWKLNIVSIYNKIIAMGAAPVICVPPIPSTNSEFIIQQREFIIEKGWDTMRFDVATTLNKDGATFDASMYTDGVHPNEKGSDAMAEAGRIALDSIV